MSWADGATAREQLGRVGTFLAVLSRAPWSDVRAAVGRVEELGYATLWLNEASGAKEPLAHAALILGATERLAVATGIANIWGRDATAARNAAFTLAEAHPGRFALGLGVSHRPAVQARGHEYRKPYSAMREYVEALGAVDYVGPAPPEPVPLVLGALRGRMLALAAERASGAHPYLVPPEHTARAREVLGRDAFLGPEVSVVVDTDPAAARERARRFAGFYLALPNYRNNLVELGFGEDEVEGKGSDRLLDALIAHGDAETVAGRVREHLDAGADHVAVQPVASDVAGTLDELARLAPLLRG
jgi:probable F420-dependent oxidoreductase